jgi:hypothetical protein
VIIPVPNSYLDDCRQVNNSAVKWVLVLTPESMALMCLHIQRQTWSVRLSSSSCLSSLYSWDIRLVFPRVENVERVAG